MLFRSYIKLADLARTNISLLQNYVSIPAEITGAVGLDFCKDRNFVFDFLPKLVILYNSVRPFRNHTILFEGPRRKFTWAGFCAKDGNRKHYHAPYGRQFCM